MPFAIDILSLDALASDPGSPAEGQIWYNTTTQQAKVRLSGSTSVLGANLFDLFLDSDPTSPTNDYSFTKTGSRVTQEKWARHSDASSLKTIDYTYTSGLVATEVVKIFASDGVTVVAQKTGTYSYTGNQVSGIAWVRNV